MKRSDPSEDALESQFAASPDWLVLTNSWKVASATVAVATTVCSVCHSLTMPGPVKLHAFDDFDTVELATVDGIVVTRIKVVGVRGTNVVVTPCPHVLRYGPDDA